MVVTELKRKGKSETYYVYLDCELFGTLELELLVKNHIKVGLELNEEDIKYIKEENDKLTCFSRALNYISSRLKTEKQMRDYLYGHNYGTEAINLAIEKLKNYGYLNDSYFAKSYLDYAGQTKGKKAIKQELFLKGVSKEKIEEVLELKEDEDEVCYSVAKKWLKGKILPLEKKDKEKLFRFLFSRGFDFELIKHTVNKLNVLDQDDEEY